MNRVMQFIPNTFQGVTIAQALQAFLLDCKAKNLSARTVPWYEQRVEYFLEFLANAHGGPANKLSLSLLTEQNVKLFIQNHKEREHRVKKGQCLSSYTVKGTVLALKVFLKYLFVEGYLEANVAGKIKTPRVQKKIIQTLSQEQIEALLSTPNKKKFTGFRNYCILMMFLDTGIRLSELLNLKAGQVDFSTNTLVVLGKGNKERRVPFGVSLRKALEKYLVWRSSLKGQEILFVNEFGERMKGRYLARIVELCGKKAGITGIRMSPHTLRHTFAKMSLLAGMDAMTLQYILGHTSLEMVRNYVNLTSQEVAIHKNRFSLMDRMELKSGVQRKKLWK